MSQSRPLPSAPAKRATLTATPVGANPGGNWPVVTPMPVVAVADLEAPAKVVRPGTVETFVEIEHDGVIKAKHLVPGLTVRAWLHGEPRGGERVIDTVTASKDGGTYSVTFRSPHPDRDYAAAYRFFVKDLAGTTLRVKKRVPALVDYTEA